MALPHKEVIQQENPPKRKFMLRSLSSRQTKKQKLIGESLIPPLLRCRGGIFHAAKAAWNSIGVMQRNLSWYLFVL